MPEVFVDYWNSERQRLDRELAWASRVYHRDHGHVRLLRKLRQIVEDEFRRWVHDLTREPRAA